MIDVVERCVSSLEDESGDKLVSVQLDDEESWLNFIDVPATEVGIVVLRQGPVWDMLLPVPSKRHNYIRKVLLPGSTLTTRRCSAM